MRNTISFDGESGVVIESSKHSSLSSKQSSGKSQTRNLMAIQDTSVRDSNPFTCLLSEQGLQATELTETTLV